MNIKERSISSIIHEISLKDSSLGGGCVSILSLAMGLSLIIKIVRHSEEIFKKSDLDFNETIKYYENKINLFFVFFKKDSEALAEILKSIKEDSLTDAELEKCLNISFEILDECIILLEDISVILENIVSYGKNDVITVCNLINVCFVNSIENVKMNTGFIKNNKKAAEYIKNCDKMSDVFKNKWREFLYESENI